MNTPKSTFLHTNNEYAETKIKNRVPFTIAPNKLKYSGIILPNMYKISMLKTTKC